MKPPYSITNKVLLLVASISEYMGEINFAHLHKPPTELRKRNRIKTIQSSLAIEGNTLTLEQVTALIEHKKVVGPKKDILEVKNAISVYEKINSFNSLSLSSFCKAHKILMHGLIESPGRLRAKSVGIMKGATLAHVAPPPKMVKPLMNDLFGFLKADKEITLIKSCVFHYELEFIHPFSDGNGRMGRFWQTVILKEKYPVFEFLPLETIIKEKQKDYYTALSKSDKTGNSTFFIEFMLEIINEALGITLNSQHVKLTGKDRIGHLFDIFPQGHFTRKEYLRHFKEISSATASRDLRLAVQMGILKKFGDKRLTRYKIIAKIKF